MRKDSHKDMGSTSFIWQLLIYMYMYTEFSSLYKCFKSICPYLNNGSRLKTFLLSWTQFSPLLDTFSVCKDCINFNQSQFPGTENYEFTLCNPYPTNAIYIVKNSWNFYYFIYNLHCSLVHLGNSGSLNQMLFISK